MGRVCWIALCAAFISRLCTLCSSQLVYAITIRDFLPTECSLVQFPDRAPHGEILTRSAVSTSCPYKSLMDAGVISGHPDFNAGRGSGNIPGAFFQANKINGNAGYIRLFDDAGRAVTTGSPTFEPTVLEYTTLAPSGLPKPQYCTGNSVVSATGMVRCGAISSEPKFSTVSKMGKQCSQKSSSNASSLEQ